MLAVAITIAIDAAVGDERDDRYVRRIKKESEKATISADVKRSVDGKWLFWSGRGRGWSRAGGWNAVGWRLTEEECVPVLTDYRTGSQPCC